MISTRLIGYLVGLLACLLSGSVMAADSATPDARLLLRPERLVDYATRPALTSPWPHVVYPPGGLAISLPPEWEQGPLDANALIERYRFYDNSGNSIVIRILADTEGHGEAELAEALDSLPNPPQPPADALQPKLQQKLSLLESFAEVDEIVRYRSSRFSGFIARGRQIDTSVPVASCWLFGADGSRVFVTFEHPHGDLDENFIGTILATLELRDSGIRPSMR